MSRLVVMSCALAVCGAVSPAEADLLSGVLSVPRAVVNDGAGGRSAAAVPGPGGGLRAECASRSADAAPERLLHVEPQSPAIDGRVVRSPRSSESRLLLLALSRTPDAGCPCGLVCSVSRAAAYGHACVPSSIRETTCCVNQTTSGPRISGSAGLSRFRSWQLRYFSSSAQTQASSDPA